MLRRLGQWLLDFLGISLTDPRPILDRPVGYDRPRPDSYVRAARLIHAGSYIRREDLEWVDRGGQYVDPDVVPGYEGLSLIGRRLTVARYRYEPIRWHDLETAGELPGHSERSEEAATVTDPSLRSG